MFRSVNGGRPDRPSFLVIFTDGVSDNVTASWLEAMEARQEGITIIAVRPSFLRVYVFLSVCGWLIFIAPH